MIGLRGSINILLQSVFVSNVGSYLIIPVLAVYLSEEGNIDIALVGTIFAVGSLAQMVGSLASGAVSNLLGIKATLICALLLRVFGFLSLLALGNFWMIILGFSAVWTGSGLYVPVSKTYISLNSNAADRGRYLAWRSAAANAGVALGPLLGVVLLEIGGYLSLFASAALVFVAATVSNLLLLAVETDESSLRASWLHYLSRARLMRLGRLVPLAFVSMFMLAAFDIIVPIYGTGLIGPYAPQLAFFVNALAVIVLQSVFGAAVSGAVSRHSPAYAFCLLGASAVLMLISNSWALFVVAVVVFSVSEVALMLSVDLSASRSPAGDLGDTYAVTAAGGSIGSAIGNQLFGLVYALTVPSSFWMFFASLAVIFAVVFWLNPNTLGYARDEVS
ncbi:MAG: MFS transporter [Beijerinckiaceae bacterium]|nr:MFS transporter [Beijerinckiaceae bacterium]